MGSLHFTDMTSHAPGVGQGQNVGLNRFLSYFDFVGAGGHPCFTNTNLVHVLILI